MSRARSQRHWMAEKGWMETVLRAARLLGWLTYHTLDSRGSSPGFPDIVLVRPPRMIFAEIKTETGRLSAEQKIWLTNLKDCPMIEAYVWRPSDWVQVDKVLR